MIDEKKTPVKAQALEEWFLKLLSCPGCPEKRPVHITPDAQALLCECGKYSFPIRDGLPILLVDEATELRKPEVGDGELNSQENKIGTTE